MNSHNVRPADVHVSPMLITRSPAKHSESIVLVVPDVSGPKPAFPRHRWVPTPQFS